MATPAPRPRSFLPTDDRMATISYDAEDSLSPHRRIELQAPADMSYLINNVSQAARRRIDLHLPPDEATSAEADTDGDTSTALGEGDGMRKRVEVLVQEYIDRVFSMVRQGVTVNGIRGVEVDGLLGEGRAEEYEPYDTRLAARITALASTIESLNLQLANMRRTAPALAAQQFADKFAAQTAQLDAALATQEEAAREDGSQRALLNFGGGAGAHTDEHRDEQTRAMYQRGTEALSRLRTGLDETEAKARKAVEVAEYLDARRSG